MLKRYREKRKIERVRKALVLLKESEYQEILSEDRLYSLRYYSREISAILENFQRHLKRNLKGD